MQEFFKQGEMEKAANLPISPNMDPNQTNQKQIQLTFTQVIVQPLFECYVELFPSTLTFMDLILDNTRQWGGYVSPDTPRRRLTEDRGKGKKASITVPLKKRSSDGNTRRVSLAAGTIDIPEAVQKFFSKKSSQVSFMSVNSERLNPSNSMYIEENDIEEEELNASIDKLATNG